MPSLALLSLAIFSILSSASASYPHRVQHVHHERSSAYSTPVEVTGAHAWQAPSSTDQRGPCPALNALANHGYISRDGVVSTTDVILTINSVLGMGLDLATILATLGTVWAGAPVSLPPKFSIAGQSRKVSGLLGLTGNPQGLNISHNLIEADSSPTRNDLYETGDAWTMDMDKFKDLLSIVPEGGLNDTVGPMADFAAKRLHQSIASNPYLFYGPFTGLVARNAGYLFISNVLSNHSAEHPSGQLTTDLLKSFFGVTDGGYGNGTIYQYGHERIPENWYKRSSDYDLVDLNLDIVKYATQQPVLASVGGNTGTVNSFTGVDLGNLSSGALNAATLLEGNNLICFALNIVKCASPSYTNDLFKTLSEPLNLILEAINTPLLSLACPSWSELESGGDNVMSVLSQFQLHGTSEPLM